MSTKHFSHSRHNDEDWQKHWPGSQQAAKSLNTALLKVEGLMGMGMGSVSGFPIQKDPNA